MKTTRRIIQFSLLLLAVAGVFVVKGDAERWCPLGGVEALYGYLTEGNMICSLGVSNLYILAGVLLPVLIVRRAFCGYLCPIGTLSEWLHAGARRLGFRAVHLPYRLDRGLAALKYAVLGVILWLTWRAGELIFRGFDPCYALLSRHGEDITLWAYVVSAAIIAGSLIVTVPFCRWLCPLAAVFAPFSRVGFGRIKRDESACVRCGECSTACPMGILVDRLEQVTASRCVSCLDCVQVCPTTRTGGLVWGPPRSIGGRWPQAVLIAITLFGVTAAVAATYVRPVPSFVKTRGQADAPTATVELRINGLTCRGRATLLTYYLERDDVYKLPGYLKLEAWPAAGPARVRITYESGFTDEMAIKEAIAEPYYDAAAGVWRPSPFEIEGYDPFGLVNEGP